MIKIRELLKRKEPNKHEHVWYPIGYGVSRCVDRSCLALAVYNYSWDSVDFRITRDGVTVSDDPSF